VRSLWLRADEIVARLARTVFGGSELISGSIIQRKIEGAGDVGQDFGRG